MWADKVFRNEIRSACCFNNKLLINRTHDGEKVGICFNQKALWNTMWRGIGAAAGACRGAGSTQRNLPSAIQYKQQSNRLQLQLGLAYNRLCLLGCFVQNTRVCVCQWNGQCVEYWSEMQKFQSSPRFERIYFAWKHWLLGHVIQWDSIWMPIERRRLGAHK